MVFLDLLGTILGALSFLGIFLYAMRKGFLKNTEDIKYQIFRDDDAEIQKLFKPRRKRK